MKGEDKIVVGKNEVGKELQRGIGRKGDKEVLKIHRKRCKKGAAETTLLRYKSVA